MKIENIDPKLLKIPDNEKIQGALVFLHGYGSNGFDMMGLSHYFTDFLDHFVYVCPNAPYPCENSPFGYQWFSLLDRDPQAIIDSVIATTAVTELLHSICEKWGLSSTQIVLMGFSQGCMTALYHGLCGEMALGALVGFSGRLLLNEQTPILHRPPLLIIHGGEDNVVPLSAFDQALISLNQHKIGYEALFRPHLGHSIDETGLKETNRFLKRVFKIT